MIRPDQQEAAGQRAKMTRPLLHSAPSIRAAFLLKGTVKNNGCVPQRVRSPAHRETSGFQRISCSASGLDVSGGDPRGQGHA